MKKHTFMRKVAAFLSNHIFLTKCDSSITINLKVESNYFSMLLDLMNGIISRSSLPTASI